MPVEPSFTRTEAPTTADLGAVRYDATPSGVAILTLNRPEQLNAWDSDIAAGFFSGLDRAEADSAIRAIVITGQGRAFCAGANLGSVDRTGEMLRRPDNVNLHELVGERLPHFLTALRKPVIAAINGSCVGIGLTLALMCDVRFAAAGAKFAAPFARRGLIAEHGIAWILPRLAGWGVALDLLLSGRTFLANEAAELRLVKEVVAPEQLMTCAMRFAEDIARHCSPASMAEIKRQMYDDASCDVTASSARSGVLLLESLGRPDVVEGITSFLEKRAPLFPPLTPTSPVDAHEEPASNQEP